jgi:hypothetical protein
MQTDLFPNACYFAFEMFHRRITGNSFSLFKKIKSGLSTLPIINHLVGEEKDEVVAELPVYV